MCGRAHILNIDGPAIAIPKSSNLAQHKARLTSRAYSHQGALSPRAKPPSFGYSPPFAFQAAYAASAGFSASVAEPHLFWSFPAQTSERSYLPPSSTDSGEVVEIYTAIHLFWRFGLSRSPLAGIF